jgi:hypothetical protein
MILKVLDKPPKNAKALIDKTIDLSDVEYAGKVKKLTVRLDLDHNDLNQIVALRWVINGKAGKKICGDGITLDAWHTFEDAVRKEIYGNANGKPQGELMRLRETIREKENRVQRVSKSKAKGKAALKSRVEKPTGKRKAKR